MTKILALRKIRFWSLLLLGMLAFASVGVNEAQAAFVAATTTCSASNRNTSGTTSLACSPSATIPVDNVAVMWFGGDNTATVNDNSQLLTSVTDSKLNSWTVQRCYSYGTPGAAAGATTCVATARITTAILTTDSITANFGLTNAKAIVVRNFSVAAGSTIEIAGTPQDVTGTAVNALGSLTISSLPPATEYLFVRSTALERTGSNVYNATTNYTLSGCSGTGSGSSATNMETCGEFRILANTSDTSNPNAGTSGSVDNVSTFIAFKEVASTTLGASTETGTATLAPSGARTLAGQFTFLTSSGNDTITNVTVGLGTGAGAGLGRVEITDGTTGTTVYGLVDATVPAPISDTQIIALGSPYNTLTAGTASTTYRIYVTPKTHAAMDPPASGVSHTVTAKISNWTGTNGHAGSDTAGITITIDNASPANVTVGTVTTASQQVTLNWANPGDADFNEVVILRSTTGSVTGTPDEGTDYSSLIGATLGNSTVVGVTAGTTFTDSGLTNGDPHDYKIFAKDSNGNYATGSTSGPHTPAGPGCYSVAGSAASPANWGSSSTWASSPLPGGTPGTCPGSGNVPDSSTPVYINFTTTSHSVVVNVSNAAATLVRIGAPGTGTVGLDIAAGTLDVGSSVTLVGGTGTKKALLSFTTGTLKLGGTITESGATSVTFGTGTVEYDGTGSQSVATYGYYNLTINKVSGTATTAANITVGNNLTVSSGTLDIVGNTVDRGAAGGTVTVSNGATLRIGGTGDFPANYTTPSLGATSTVEYYGGAQVVTTLTAPYGHLSLSGAGTKDLGAGTITVAGNFSIGSGTTCDANANDPTLNVAGNFTNNGTFTAGTSTVVLNGTAAQSISGGATTFNNLTISNSAGASASVALTTNGALILNSSAVFSTSAVLTANGAFTLNASAVFNAGSSSHSFKGAFSNSGTFNANTSTVTFNGTTAQAITGTTTFYGLVFDNAAGFTLNNNITAGNALTLTSGVITTGTNTLIFGSTTSCSVTRTSGRVNGKLRKHFSGSLLACDFEVGDASKYTRVSITFASVSTEGDLTVSTTSTGSASGDHIEVDTDLTDIDKTQSVNRYWTLLNTGIVFSTYDATFNFCDSTVTTSCPSTDIDAGATPTEFIIRRRSPEYPTAGSWSNVVRGSALDTSTTGTNIADFGDFAIGRSSVRAFSREREFIFHRERYY